MNIKINVGDKLMVTADGKVFAIDFTRTKTAADVNREQHAAMCKELAVSEDDSNRLYYWLWQVAVGEVATVLQVIGDIDAIAALETLVSTIDDPDFDASNPDCVRDLVQYINVQCRAVVK